VYTELEVGECVGVVVCCRFVFVVCVGWRWKLVSVTYLHIYIHIYIHTYTWQPPTESGDAFNAGSRGSHGMCMLCVLSQACLYACVYMCMCVCCKYVRHCDYPLSYLQEEFC
jgi:hypothetical protein